MIQTKRERERIKKKKYQQTERVNESNKKRVRVRVRENMKTLEERKEEKQQFIRNMYMEDMQT